MQKNENLYLKLLRLEQNSNTFYQDDQVFLKTAGREPLLYKQLHSLTGQLHNRLLELGVKPNDRVVVQVAKSYEAVLVYLTCLRIGAIYIPLNTAYTESEVSYFLSDATPQLFICDLAKEQGLTELADTLSISYTRTLGEKGEGSLFNNIEQLSDKQVVAYRAKEDLASILYTSGTTGRSKGAMLSHANLYTNAQTLHDHWQWDDKRDVLLHALPIFHVHGLFVALHCAMLGQSTIHFLTQFNVDTVIQSLADSTVMMGVPTFYTRLLDTAEFTSQTCEKMRLFISGSAPLLSETHKQFEEKTGHKILERYGMTECGMITSNPFNGERIAGTVGFSLPDISVRVADEQGNTLKNNEIGVLEVKGPNVFSGYWQMPKKTKQEFREDGYFITGDLSTMDEQGRVSIVGRAKDLIISGGFNIYPKEIESKIDEILGVKESAVIGVTHSDFGEAAVAVVVQEQQAKLTNADIQVQLRQDLANFKQPKKIIFVDELPRNTMGKVQKVQLRKAYQAAFSS